MLGELKPKGPKGPNGLFFEEKNCNKLAFTILDVTTQSNLADMMGWDSFDPTALEGWKGQTSDEDVEDAIPVSAYVGSSKNQFQWPPMVGV